MLRESRSEDTLRPEPGSTESARVEHPGPNGSYFRSAAAVIPPHRSPIYLGALERVMYRPQFVLLGADNVGRGIVRTLDAARAALADGTVPTVAGKLANGLLGSDIDADDPLIGDACAEALIAWCHQHGLPYLLRESGRPGGRHVIAVVTNDRVPVKEWSKLCRELSRRFRVVVQDRTGLVLRLLTAPHRVGLPAPVIACTITPDAVMDAVRFHRPKSGKTKSGRRRDSASRTVVGAGDEDMSRSGQEYGMACAMARAGWVTQQAWERIADEYGKAAERGKAWFLRYVWERAITTVAAENGLSEDQAWELVQRECPAVRSRGRDTWRYWWRRAQDEATVDRPRRYRLPDDPENTDTAGLPPEVAAEVDAMRHGLRGSVDAELAHLDPRRRHSIHATVYALAYAIVTRDGSMSLRTLAERARIDYTTVRASLGTAVDSGILIITRRYAQGAADCHAYGVGPAAEHEVSAAQRISPLTRCTTPAPQGSASRSRLRSQHALDRRRWALRCDVMASLAPGERLADSQHPAAKLMRSLWYQRKWWNSLTSEEQQERREHRRALLRGLDSTDRSAWFDWLERRELIANAADRLTLGHLAEEDPHTLSGVVITLHRGMADPSWRNSGRPDRVRRLAA